MSRTRPDPAELRELCLLSRGDRVRVVCSGPGDDVPLVLALGPDGAADSAWTRALRGACPEAWCVAGVDLPLCGARHSDKLSRAAFDPADPLAARLRPDLERQTATDLECVRDALGSGRPLALAASGIGAELGLAWCALRDDLRAAAIVAPEPARARSALGPRGHAARVWSGDEAPPVEALVELLRRGLG